MKIKEFITKVEDLYLTTYKSDQFIIDRIKKQKRKFLSLLDDLDEEGYRYLEEYPSAIESNIKYLYSSIERSILTFLEGHFDISCNIIYHTFFDTTNNKRIPLRAKVLRPHTPFFRMRQSNSYDLYEAREMFHIPFEKRNLTSNQRYSMSGYPCLYLGSSIYGCWEELKRPNIDLSNIVYIENTEPIRLINLSIPRLDLRTIGKFDIYNVVLSLVCSLKVGEYNAPFKPEYIIPQNVLNCLITRNNDPDAPYFDGIKYTSSIYGSKRCIFHNKQLFENYVLPIKQSKSKGYCDELCNLFAISQPTTMTIDRLKRKHWIRTSSDDYSSCTPYKLSEFEVIEDTLSHSELQLVRDIVD